MGSPVAGWWWGMVTAAWEGESRGREWAGRPRQGVSVLCWLVAVVVCGHCCPGRDCAWQQQQHQEALSLLPVGETGAVKPLHWDQAGAVVRSETGKTSGWARKQEYESCPGLMRSGLVLVLGVAAAAPAAVQREGEEGCWAKEGRLCCWGVGWMSQRRV